MVTFKIRSPPSSSLGVILFALVTGCLPFSGPDDWVIYQKIEAGDFAIPSFVSAECGKLICCLLTPGTVT